MADNYSVTQQLLILKKENKTGLPDNLKTGMKNLYCIVLATAFSVCFRDPSKTLMPLTVVSFKTYFLHE